jgi:AcrR family transcriptional regulator
MYVSHGEVSAVNGEAGHTRRTQAERRASTRAALVAAARELFTERGFAGAGREDIVQRAGVTRGAMYHHFTSKEALFREVYEQIEGELSDQIATAALAAAGPVEALRAGVLAFLDAAVQPDVRRICLLDAPSVLPVELRRELAEKYGLGLVRESLRELMDAGVIAKQPLEPLAHVLLAALHEAAVLVADGHDRAEVDTVVDRFLEML